MGEQLIISLIADALILSGLLVFGLVSYLIWRLIR